LLARGAWPHGGLSHLAGRRVVFPPGWCSFSLLPGFFGRQGGLAAFDGLSRSHGDVAGALDRFRLA
jgi:hypothetical protein